MWLNWSLKISSHGLPSLLPSPHGVGQEARVLSFVSVVHESFGTFLPSAFPLLSPFSRAYVDSSLSHLQRERRSEPHMFIEVEYGAYRRITRWLYFIRLRYVLFG